MIENIEQSKNVLTVYDLKLNLIASGIDPYGLKPELHKCSSQSGLPIKKVYCKVKPGYIGEPKVVLKIISDCGFSMRLSR